MWPFTFLKSQARARRLQSLAVDLAHEHAGAVWRRVNPRVVAMRSAEARGYIRSRAAAIIHSAAAFEAARHPSLAAWGDDLAQRTTDEVVRTLSLRLAQTPERFIGRRKAA